MGEKLYAGNIGYGVKDADLSQLFAQHGTAESAIVIMDKMTGRDSDHEKTVRRSRGSVA